MDTAHELFHADSRHLLAFLSGTPSGRRERSLILRTAFMRAAGLEFGEQGDVWARIVEQRCALHGELPDPSTWASFTGDVRRLLLGKVRPDETTSDWLTAFEEEGRQLRVLRESGRLTRGIRAATGPGGSVPHLPPGDGAPPSVPLHRLAPDPLKLYEKGDRPLEIVTTRQRYIRNVVTLELPDGAESTGEVQLSEVHCIAP